MDNCCNFCETKRRNDEYESFETSEDSPLTPGQSCAWKYSSFIKKLQFGAWSLTVLSFVIIVCFIILVSPTVYLSPHLLKTNLPHGAVATDNKVCSKIGIDILQDGGNAIDAAVASTVCMTVLAPEKIGLGGGGIALVYNNLKNEKKNEQPFIVDFATNTISGVFASARIRIPSVLRGLELLHSRKGKLSWNKLIEPAANLAQNGFIISNDFAQKVSENPEHGITHGHLIAGEILKLKPLADTLKAVAQQSTNTLYNGTLTKKLLKDAVVQDNLFNELASYEPRVISAEKFEFYGYQVYYPNYSKSIRSSLESIHSLGIDVKNYSDDSQVEIAQKLVGNDAYKNLNPCVDEEKYTSIVALDSDENFVSIIIGMSVSMGLRHMSGAGFLFDSVDTGNNLDSLTPIIFVKDNKVSKTIGMFAVDDPVLGMEILSNFIFGRMNVSSAIERQRYYQFSKGIKIESQEHPNFPKAVKNKIESNQPFLIKDNEQKLGLKSVNAILKENESISSHSDSRGGGVAYRY